MGYQESYIPIKHLAEAAGIRDAVRKYQEEGYWHWYCCAVRTRSVEDNFELPNWTPGKLYACVAGDRSPYTRPGSYMLDEFFWTHELYLKYFEDLDEEEVNAAAADHPEIAEAARRDMDAYLAHVWDDDRSAYAVKDPDEEQYDIPF